eukprot:1583513-Prorocentrum_lima.AAC.1
MKSNYPSVAALILVMRLRGAAGLSALTLFTSFDYLIVQPDHILGNLELTGALLEVLCSYNFAPNEASPVHHDVQD